MEKPHTRLTLSSKKNVRPGIKFVLLPNTAACGRHAPLQKKKRMTYIIRQKYILLVSCYVRDLPTNLLGV